MKKIVMDGHVFEYNTVEELKDIMAVMGMSKGTRKGTGKPAPEKVEFVKKDGTVKMVSPKQAAVWEAARSRSNGKTLDEVKAEYEAKHKAFKPSDELIRALKEKPTMTRNEAKAYGFVGTKDELKALKLAHKVYAK